ncbi:putative chitin deacetylase [Emericellopsis atlantica]|uniref:Chitin deacetylase n=1 Tax=Emericellopsis atlantica TaxID=2614577 RepID=A0A9P7ZHL5_9HYPO|nr:putative chitin deacetylase [Emericellopsis atlantica]KAG9251643.1 putative chitin deacetylase [Emericellopsis atlantica]
MLSIYALLSAIAGLAAAIPTASNQGRATELEARQDRRCGIEFNRSCPEGQCCSSGGWCGVEYAHCRAPICQIDFGPACDANIRPEGPDTKDIARPKVGNVPYGKGVYTCNTNGVVALTFDDGPWENTEYLLDLLAQYDAKATFFVVGRNMGKGAMNDPSTPWPALIRRMIDEGHQIGSHTWSHQKLTEITAAQFQNQMIFNEIALADLLGYFPTYMRPPHSMSDATTDAWLADLGYHVTYFDLNTLGYENDDATLIQNSKDIWDRRVEPLDPASASVLHIEHDPLYQTVHNLTEYVLQSLVRNDFRSVPVGECLGDPRENWYRKV